MDKLIVACNKIDTLKDDQQKLKKQVSTLQAQISKTRFGPSTKVVPEVAATLEERCGQTWPQQPCDVQVIPPEEDDHHKNIWGRNPDDLLVRWTTNWTSMCVCV